jgi:hypothetical protein
VQDHYEAARLYRRMRKVDGGRKTVSGFERDDAEESWRKRG